MINKSDEWKTERHRVLDEYLETFVINAHKMLNRIMDLDKVDNTWFIASDSSQVLPQTVINIMCSQCACKPNSKQKEWAGEVLMLKKVLK